MSLRLGSPATIPSASPPLCFTAPSPADLRRVATPPPVAAIGRAPPAPVSSGSFVAPLPRRPLLAAPRPGGMAGAPSPPPSPPAAVNRRPLAPSPTTTRPTAVSQAAGGRQRSPGGAGGGGSDADAAWKRLPLAGVPSRAVREASSGTRRPDVAISAPAWNKRTIRSAILIRASLPTVWSALTDYSRLSTFIPNLAYSKQRFHPTGGIRLEQWGVQRIVGFQFKAAVVLDMTEVTATDSKERAIDFVLASSRDFAAFFGTWRMSAVEGGGTWLEYDVNIQPKGLVPVKAVEWRIKEDVPSNLLAVRSYCELLDRRSTAAEMRLASENSTANSQTDV